MRNKIGIFFFLLSLVLSPGLSFAQGIYNTTCPGTGCVTTSVQNQGALGIQITGTWVGTITFKGTVSTSSSATYTDLLVTKASDLSNATTTTANGLWLVSTSGLGQVRIQFTSYSSGTANVSVRAVSPARSSLSATIDATVSDVTITSSALPDGAATSVKQDTSNTLLTNLALALGSAVGGDQSTRSLLSGCIYNAIQPSLTNGQQIGLQCDDGGNLKIAADISLSGDVTVTSSALPTGASTAANQATQITAAETANTSLGLLDDAIGSKTGGTAGTSSNLAGGVYVSSAPTLTNGQQASLRLTSAGELMTTASVTLGTLTGVSTSGCYLVSAASNNATNCKASAGSLYGIRIVNTTDTIYYLRLYNLASAPTCSSATGFIESIPIPASTDGNGVVWSTMNPVAYSTGIGFCFTSGSSSTNNGSAATGVFGAILYN